MKSKTRIFSKKYLPVWLALILLIASGAGAALGSIVAGKVTGDISINTSGSAGGLHIGEPLCDTITHSVDEALEVSGNETDMAINTWPPGFGFSEIPDLDNLAFSDDVYQSIAASPIRISQQIYRFYVGDGDNIDKLVINWEGYGEVNGTLRVYDNTGAAWGMAESIETSDSTLSIKITDSTDINISEAVSGNGYVYVQAFLSAVNNSLFADYVTVTATYSAIDWANWAGFDGPEIANREFPVPNRCIGVHSDDQTGFEAASELGIGDWWLFMLPVKNAGSSDIAAELTLDVPGCLNVYIMSADEVGHANPRVTDAVRSGANTWQFLVDADAAKQDDADYLYVILNAHNDCGPDYYTITGTIEGVSFASQLSGPEQEVSGVTSVSSIVDASGNFTQSVYPQSADGLVILSIEKGTVGLTAGGEPLSEITIRKMASPPPPPADGSIIGLPYNLGPIGATFNPPIRITFRYNPADIPPGVLESNLNLAWWDETIGDWVLLANITVDTVNNKIGADVSHFTAFSPVGFESPTVETVSETELTALSATLNGDLTDLGDSPTVDLYFEWGTDTTYGNSINATPASTSAIVAFSAGLTNLTPQTTYYFRAVGDGHNHGIDYGDDMTFTTPELCTVNTTGAVDITGLSANLTGELTSLYIPAGHPGVEVGFELGTTVNYSMSGPVGTLTAPGTFSIEAVFPFISANTTYHYRAFAYDGVQYYYGADITFTTPVLCTVNTTGAVDITDVSANLTGQVTVINVPPEIWGMGGMIGAGFELEFSSNQTAVLSTLQGYAGTLSGTGPFSLLTTNVGVSLLSDTEYRFRAWMTFGGTTFYYGEWKNFFTLP